MTSTDTQRSGRAPVPLAGFADEVAGLAEKLRGTRFHDSERYVMDADATARELADIATRMRRVASETPTPAARDEHAALVAQVFGKPAAADRMDAAPVRRPVTTTTIDQRGRTVPVERRRG